MNSGWRFWFIGTRYEVGVGWQCLGLHPLRKLLGDSSFHLSSRYNLPSVCCAWNLFYYQINLDSPSDFLLSFASIPIENVLFGSLPSPSPTSLPSELRFLFQVVFVFLGSWHPETSTYLETRGSKLLDGYCHSLGLRWWGVGQGWTQSCSSVGREQLSGKNTMK